MSLFNDLYESLKPDNSMDYDYSKSRITALENEVERLSDMLQETLEELESMYDNVTDVYEGVDPYSVFALINRIKNVQRKNG